MNRPAFFVDGQTEQRALNKLCPGHPIRVIGCNGRDVSIAAIAERLSSHIRLLNNRNYPIIVIIDREGRQQSSDQIKSELKAELKKLAVEDEILIGVCDKMIENWILADFENFEKYINKQIKNKLTNYEGQSGKSIVKKLYPDYHETTDGVNLLCSSNPLNILKNSESFKSFAIEIKKINCQWLNQLITHNTR